MTAYNSYNNTILADTPALFYKLAESSGTTATDSSGNGHNGTYTNTGGITYGVSGLVRGDSDTCVTLASASSSYIAASITGLPTGASAWSMECWVKTPASLPGTGLPTLMMFGTNSGAEAAYLIYSPSSGKWRLTDFTANICTSAASVTTSTSYYLCVTYDGTTAKLYINNAAVVSAAHTFAIVASLATIGGDTTTGDYWNGSIGKSAYYASALSATQVANHYNAGLAIIKNMGTRLRLAIPKTVSLPGRLRVAITKDVSFPNRLRLNAAKDISFSQRLRLAIAKKVSLPGRLRISLTRDVSLPGRVRIAPTKYLSLPGRVRIAPTKDASLPGRVRIAVLKTISCGGRLRLSFSAIHALNNRLRLSALTRQSLGARLILPGAPPPLTPTFFPSLYTGWGALPLLTPPSGVYSVNGTILDTQPILLTSPFTSNQQIPVGSSFALGFVSPSTLTQSLLASGTSATLQFSLIDGLMVSGQVQIYSQSSGSFFLVVATTLAPIQIYRWTFSAQTP